MMRKLFFRFISLLFVFFILIVILLHLFSNTPSAKVPGFTSLYLLPDRGFKHAIIFSNEEVVKNYITHDSLGEWFYAAASGYLKRGLYTVKYSMIVKNAIGKYVLYATYNNGSFMLISKPRFRLKVLRGFVGGEDSEYEGIPIKKIGRLYVYFIEDYLVMSPDVNLIKSSIDLALGKRRGSVFDNTGPLEEYDMVVLSDYSGKLLKISPFVIGLNHKKLVIKGSLASSVIKDAIKRGKLPDSIPSADVFLMMKIPYLELYDSYVNYYPDDKLDLSAVLWDAGGEGYLWYDRNGNFLVSLESRVEEERMVQDIFSYFKEKGKVDRVLIDTTGHVYRFMKGDNSMYILKYIIGLEHSRFVFTNSKDLFEKFNRAKYVKFDGRISLKNIDFLKSIFQFSPVEINLIDKYMVNDSIVPSVWNLEFKEYKEGLLIKGKKAE